MKKNKITFAAILLLTTGFLFFLYFHEIQEQYIHFFKLTTLATYKNKSDTSVETNVYYLNGKIRAKSTNFKSMKVRRTQWYYDNGKVESNKHFKNNLSDGKDTDFYINGKIHSISNWLKGKKYGESYYFYQNGNIEAYHCFDMLGKKFFLLRTDSLNRMLKHQGNPFSNYIYSINYQDSLLYLKNGVHYRGIKDLFITVATPRNLNIAFFVIVNNKKIEDLKIKDNVMQIPNIFSAKGMYTLSIGGRLSNKNQEILSTKVLDLSLVVD